MFYNIDPTAKFYKTFAVVIYKFLWYAGVFVPGKPFQPSLLFAGKAGAYPSEVPFWRSNLG